MYMFRDDINITIRQKQAVEVLGLTKSALSKIMNKKMACRKVVAYAITKYMNQDSEIEDYFVRIK